MSQQCYNRGMDMVGPKRFDVWIVGLNPPGIDKIRLIKKIGEIDKKTKKLLCEVLIDNFRY